MQQPDMVKMDARALAPMQNGSALRMDIVSSSLDELVRSIYSDTILANPGGHGMVTPLERIRQHFGYQVALWWDGRVVINASEHLHDLSFPIRAMSRRLARWNGMIASPLRWEFLRDVSGHDETVDRFAFYPSYGSPSASSSLRTALTHLLAAHDIAKKLRAPLPAAPAVVLAEETGHARVIHKGRIVQADTRFNELVRAVDRGWDGQTLPFVLRWGPRLMANGHVFKSLCFRVERVEEGVYDVAVHRNSRSPCITPREWAVAERVARGMTYKEIAREMDVASSTVSSHVYTIYDKIGVRRRSELVDWFGRQAVIGPRQS